MTPAVITLLSRSTLALGLLGLVLGGFALLAGSAPRPGGAQDRMTLLVIAQVIALLAAAACAATERRRLAPSRLAAVLRWLGVAAVVPPVVFLITRTLASGPHSGTVLTVLVAAVTVQLALVLGFVRQRLLDRS